jgi:hypothetical protein
VKLLVPGATDKGTGTENLVSVYPNPVAGTLNIEYTMQDAGTFRAELTTVLGRVIYRSPEVQTGAGFQRTTIDLSGIPAGIYLLNANCGTERQTVKVIVN